MDNMDELNDQFKKSANDFSLTPSPGTWSNVQADIHARKRKRRFIIYFFLIAGIVSGGLFLLDRSTSRKTEILPPETSLTPTESQKPPTTQQNVSGKKGNLPKEHFSAQQSNSTPKKNTSTAKTPSQDKKQHDNGYPASRKIKPEKSESSPVTESEYTPPPVMLLEEDNLVSGNPESSQACETTSFPTPLSELDNSGESFTSTISNDSLQTRTKKDSLLAIKTETNSKTDSSVIIKDTLKNNSYQSKWSIVIGVAPTTCHSKLDEKGDYQFISHYRDSSDKNLLTWNFHLNLAYNFLPEIGFFTGIGIEHVSQEILSNQAVYKYDTSQSLTVGPTPPTITVGKSSFHINGDSTGTVKNKFTYLEIPVGIRYDFLRERKFNISLLPEISFNKLIASEGYRYNFQNFMYQKITDADLKPWLVSYGVGLAFQYAVKKNICLELTPYYKSFQKSIWNTSDDISQRFQQTEFRFSLRYLLK